MQYSFQLEVPRFRLRDEWCASLPDAIICELTETGSTFSSHGTVDHPSFTRLRNYLEARGYITTSRVSSNGDKVTKEFYLNDVLFKPGEVFFCASAMEFHLERSEKHPLKKTPPIEYDAVLKDWRILPTHLSTGLVVYGTIVEDKKGRFHSGDRITTSLIEKFLNHNHVQTLNTVYQLV